MRHLKKVMVTRGLARSDLLTERDIELRKN